MSRRRANPKTAAIQLFGIKNKMEPIKDRQLMITVLSHSSDRRFRELINQLTDDVNKRTSFVALCDKCGLTYQDVTKEFKAIRREQGLIGVFNQLPEIMEQMAFDSKSRWEICPKCKGTKLVVDAVATEKAKKEAAQRDEEVTETFMVECGYCEGEGKKYYLGDIDRLKLTLETAELTSKSRFGIFNQIITNPPEQEEKMEDLMGNLGQLIQGEGQMK